MGEAWYQHGGGLELVQELFAQYNAHVIKMGDTAGQMGGWFRKEINTVDDLKGLKFRIGGFAGRIVSQAGRRSRSRSRPATSIRRWKRARSTRWNGSRPPTTRSSVS